MDNKDLMYQLIDEVVERVSDRVVEKLVQKLQYGKDVASVGRKLKFSQNASNEDGVEIYDKDLVQKRQPKKTTKPVEDAKPVEDVKKTAKPVEDTKPIEDPKKTSKPVEDTKTVQGITLEELKSLGKLVRGKFVSDFELDKKEATQRAKAILNKYAASFSEVKPEDYQSLREDFNKALEEGK